jgi:hypothetical protein
MAIETKIESHADPVAWPATLCEAFQKTATRFADQVALRTLGGFEEITWGEYAQRVQKKATIRGSKRSVARASGIFEHPPDLRQDLLVGEEVLLHGT